MKIVTMRGKKEQLNGLRDLINYINNISNVKDLNIIEVGSYQGESTYEFAKRFKTVTAVDPWLTGYDERDAASRINGDAVESAFDKRLSEFSNVIKKKMKSVEYAELVEDASVDVVYIDGDHRPESVLKDLKAWIPKIKPNGFLTGHDAWTERVKTPIAKCNLKIDTEFKDTSLSLIHI